MPQYPSHKKLSELLNYVYDNANRITRREHLERVFLEYVKKNNIEAVENDQRLPVSYLYEQFFYFSPKRGLPSPRKDTFVVGQHYDRMWHIFWNTQTAALEFCTYEDSRLPTSNYAGPSPQHMSIPRCTIEWKDLERQLAQSCHAQLVAHLTSGSANTLIPRALWETDLKDLNAKRVPLDVIWDVAERIDHFERHFVPMTLKVDQFVTSSLYPYLLPPDQQVKRPRPN